MDFGLPDDALFEEAATASEEALAEYLETGGLTDGTLAELARTEEP